MSFTKAAAVVTYGAVSNFSSKLHSQLLPETTEAFVFLNKNANIFSDRPKVTVIGLWMLFLFIFYLDNEGSAGSVGI